MQWFRNFPVAKNFMDIGGGVIQILRRKKFSHSAEKLRSGTFYCLTNFKYRKILGIKERGEHQDFLSKIISLTVPKNFVGQPFCAVFQKFSGSEKFYGEKGGTSRFFCRKICLSLPKNFVGQPFCAVFQKFSGSEKVYRERAARKSRFSVGKIFSHSAKNFAGESFTASLIAGVENC